MSLKKLKKPGVHGEDELFEIVHPVLLQIFCEGIQVTSKRHIIGSCILQMLMIPLDLFMIVFRKIAPVLILGATWLAMYLTLDDLGGIAIIMMTLSFVFVLMKEMESEFIDISILVLNLVTAGGLLKWICRAHLRSEEFGSMVLLSSGFERAVAALVPALPERYHGDYNKVFDLYWEAEGPDAAGELSRKLIALRTTEDDRTALK